MKITDGLYVQLVNRYTNAVIFSAATDEMTLDAFEVFWRAIGETIFNGAAKPTRSDGVNIGSYELRVERIHGR